MDFEGILGLPGVLPERFEVDFGLPWEVKKCWSKPAAGPLGPPEGLGRPPGTILGGFLIFFGRFWLDFQRIAGCFLVYSG